MDEPEPVDLEEARAFVIMPFASDFDDVHEVVKQAVLAVDKGLSWFAWMKSDRLGELATT